MNKKLTSVQMRSDKIRPTLKVGLKNFTFLIMLEKIPIDVSKPGSNGIRSQQ